MKRSYDMVLVDLDGTLLTDEKKIGEQDIETLQHLIDQGIKVVIATGRSYASAKQLSNPVNRDLVIMANNGTVVRDGATDHLLDLRTLPWEAIQMAYTIGAAVEEWPLFHINRYEEGKDIAAIRTHYTDPLKRYLQHFSHRFKVLDRLDDLKREQVLAMIYLGDYDKLEEMERQLHCQSSMGLNTHVVGQLIHFDGMLEIMNEEGSKWRAATRLAEKWGIDTPRIVAVGDDLNDLAMITYAGRGIAMKNAHPRILEAADEVSEKTNNEGGLSLVLQRLFPEYFKA